MLITDRKIAYRNRSNHNGYKLYDCELKKDDMLLICRADIPYISDGYVGFKVRKSKWNNCTSDVCTHGNRKTILFYRDHEQSNLIDDAQRYAKSYHFCERFTYGNKVCDVNYYIQDSYFIDGALITFNQAMEKMISVFGLLV